MANSKFFWVLLLLLASTVAGCQSQGILTKKERNNKARESTADRIFLEGVKLMALGKNEDARNAFQNALKIRPDDPVINYKLAEVYARNGEAKQALTFASKASNMDPENKYYALLLAEIYTQMNEPLRAAEILDRLTANSEENQQYTLELASIYLRTNNPDKALLALDRAEKYYGVREPITFQKQRIYLQKNQLDKAVEEGKRLVEANPGNPSPVLNLVEILYNNNQTDKALDIVSIEIQKYPNQPELQLAAYTLHNSRSEREKALPYLYRAFASSDLDQGTKADAFGGILKEFKTSERQQVLDSLQQLMLQEEIRNPEVYRVLGEHEFQKNQIEKSHDWYKKSLQLNPKNEELIEKIVLGSFGTDTSMEELEQYTLMGVDEFPTRPDFWFYDGVVKSVLKKDSSAVSSLKQAIFLNDGKNNQLDQVAFGTLGSSYYSLNVLDSSFHYFEKALKLNAEDEQVLNNYAYFLSLEKKDLEKARTMAAKVVRKHPKNATFLDTYAWVLFQLGEYEEAYRYMEQALKNEPEPNAVLLEHFGDILYHLGEKTKAISYWEKAAESPEKSDLLPKKIRDKKYYD